MRVFGWYNFKPVYIWKHAEWRFKFTTFKILYI